jgi:hypothetical protein
MTETVSSKASRGSEASAYGQCLGLCCKARSLSRPDSARVKEQTPGPFPNGWALIR